VAADGDLGADLHDGVEDDRPVGLARGDVDLRRGDDIDLVLPHRLRVVLGQRVAQAPISHTCPAAQRVPHMPQLVASVLVSTQRSPHAL